MSSAPFLTRVKLANYKSIKSCELAMQPLMFLVGPNGSGKSNFLDALRFVSDSLDHSLDHALRERGGVQEVRRRSGGHPTHFSIELTFQLPRGGSGSFRFRVGARPQGGFELQEEACKFWDGQLPGGEFHYLVEKGVLIESSMSVAPPVAADRLYLSNAAGLPGFREVYDALTHMGFYNLNPDRMRDLQSPDSAPLLLRDGRNLTSVLGRMSQEDPDARERIEEILSVVAPGILGVDVRHFGPKETLEFRQRVAGAKDPWRFYAAGMSDGTVRALGVLVALFQPGTVARGRPTLIGIEEPEVALHPAALGALMDGLREAALSTQVMVTSHSPELLDFWDGDPDALCAVRSVEGVSHVAPIDRASRMALRDDLYRPGELLRQNQFIPAELESPQLTMR